ncbi:MAG: CoA-binding protein [Psychroserpens sp.]|nr:CoA-binding protein [Psychroserpens sp.]
MKRTLVLGASLKPERYSNMAIQRLISSNHEVVAYGPKEGTIAGVDIDTTLIAYENIHTLTLYLNPKRQESFYDYIVSLKPERVIFNPGTENLSLQQILKENDIYYEEACTLVLLGTNQY